MVNDKELAAIIARSIFEQGGPDVERIQFMIGKNPERAGATETIPTGATTCVIEVWGGAGAGYGLEPLADFIEGVLREHRSY